MSLAPLITAADLRATLSEPTYMALFDDDQSGVVASVDASDGVAMCLRRAHIRCVSWLGVNYSKVPLVTDTDVPDLLIDAELNYATGIAFDRHPEYTRQYGEDPRRKAAYDQAELTMLRVQEAILQFVDSASMKEPENVGGIIVNEGQKMFLGATSGALNSGDF